MIDRAQFTATTNANPRALTSRARDVTIWAPIAMAMVLAIALSWPKIVSVWSAGEFFDSDDAMRAVQVRDLLAGQGWFDMEAHRLDPPEGVLAHWSRVIDVPLAALEMGFRSFLSPEASERAARLVFPLALFAVLLRLSAWCAGVLGGSAARHVAVWTVFLTGATFMQFAPGRIDHHAPQIVLLMASLCFFLMALESRGERAMAASSAMMAVSVAISLENLPFFAVMTAALLVLFTIDGTRARGVLGWFAAGALVSFPLCFVATVSPSRYLVSACDAYSSVHVVTVLLGSIGVAALSVFAPRLVTWQQRAAASGLVGATTFQLIDSFAPQCIGDPLVGLDPLLRDLWLSHVKEAQPLFLLWRDQPGAAVAAALPILIGFAIAAGFAISREGVARSRWAVFAATIAIGLAGGLWQVRVLTSVAPLAATSSAIGAVFLARRLAKSSNSLIRSFVATALCFSSSSMGIALAAPLREEGPAKEISPCFRRGALEPLSKIEPAPVAAPIDMGPFVLAFTPHSVFGAPYHRNNRGNRVIVDAFLAKPDAAERILRSAGAEIVVWCQREGSTPPLVERAPEGLAAALSRGEVPNWLDPVAPKKGPVHVFAVRPEQ